MQTSVYGKLNPTILCNFQQIVSSKKTNGNFGQDDDANIYQHVLILVITPRF